jgi:hypothetical protein
MKLCTLCNIAQPLENFHKGKAYKDGRRTWCKVCMAAYKKQYSASNRDKILAKQRAYDAAKNEERREYSAKRYIAKKQHIDAANKEYRRLYPHKHAAKEMQRKVAKMYRTPSWLTDDDHWIMEQAYEFAALRTKMLGIPFEVDHIIPLQGKLVSGLHVPENLQVIPARANRQKCNRFEVAS